MEPDQHQTLGCFSQKLHPGEFLSGTVGSRIRSLDTPLSVPWAGLQVSCVLIGTQQETTGWKLQRHC